MVLLERLTSLEHGVLYVLDAQRGALEAQATNFQSQAQQVRWGTANLPPGVSHQATADQLDAAAEKILAEVKKIEVLREAIEPIPDESVEDKLAKHGLVLTATEE